MLKRTSMTVDREVRDWVEKTRDFQWRKSFVAAMELPLDLQRFVLNDPAIAQKYALTPLSRYFSYGRREWQALMSAARRGHRMTSYICFLRPARITVEISIYNDDDERIFNLVTAFDAIGQVARVNEP